MLKSPFTFDVSVWEVLMPMITGCKVVVCKPDGHVDPLYIQDLGDTEGVTILHFVPSMLDAFLSVVDRKKMRGTSGGDVWWGGTEGHHRRSASGKATQYPHL